MKRWGWVLVAALAAFLIGWREVLWPPPVRPCHRWRLEMQNGETKTLYADQIYVHPDPVLAGYSVVTALGSDGDTIAVYGWVYTVRRADPN
jgi:hypothetical protein